VTGFGPHSPSLGRLSVRFCNLFKRLFEQGNSPVSGGLRLQAQPPLYFLLSTEHTYAHLARDSRQVRADDLPSSRRYVAEHRLGLVHGHSQYPGGRRGQLVAAARSSGATRTSGLSVEPAQARYALCVANSRSCCHCGTRKPESERQQRDQADIHFAKHIRPPLRYCIAPALWRSAPRQATRRI
jgi:hypothetical protein